jgi:hypothetical protein
MAATARVARRRCLGSAAPTGARRALRRPAIAPTVYTGTAEIGAYFRDVCGRNIEHEVRDLVATEAGLAFTQHCRYPEGERVVCATIATLHHGKIKTQTAVQLWDG